MHVDTETKTVSSMSSGTSRPPQVLNDLHVHEESSPSTGRSNATYAVEEERQKDELSEPEGKALVNLEDKLEEEFPLESTMESTEQGSRSNLYAVEVQGRYALHAHFVPWEAERIEDRAVASSNSRI